MSDETLQLITQQPMDNPAAPNRYYPFPPIAGLPKPARPAAARVRQVGLQLANGQARRQSDQSVTLNASPFHGITRLAVEVDGVVSQDFNNGKGDVDARGELLPQGKQGRYFDEVDDILAINPAEDSLRICWKVRNPDGFRTIKFELFAPGRSTPIWSLIWDKSHIAANIRQGALTAGFQEKDGEFAPITWTGSLDWDQAVHITDPAFPNGQLTAEQSPYQLRMTGDDNDPGPDRAGYPLVAWTYFYVPDDMTDSATQDTGWLAVQLFYEGMSLADLPVQFYTLTADNRPGQPIGAGQRTDAAGIVMLAESVPWADYGCAIENQPLAIVSPVEDPATPLMLTLPIGEPQLEVFVAIGDELDEEEELEDDDVLEEPLAWEDVDEDEVDEDEAVEDGEPIGAQQVAEDEDQGWLVVQLFYEGMPLADLPVQFHTLTADNRQGQPVGAGQRTDAAGIVMLAEPVPWADYGCAIENQPLAIVSPMEDPATPLMLILPIGEPQLEVFVAIGDELDEEEDEEELDEEESTPA